EVGRLGLLATDRGPADDGQHALAEQALGAGVRRGGVVGGVAVDELQLLAVDPAGRVHLVEVGAHGVPLDGGVEGTGLVEDAADGDQAVVDEVLRVVDVGDGRLSRAPGGAPGRRGGAPGGRGGGRRGGGG